MTDSPPRLAIQQYPGAGGREYVRDPIPPAKTKAHMAQHVEEKNPRN
jgi:hypothetical protein